MREFTSQDLFKQWGVSPTFEYGEASYPLVYRDATITPVGCYDSDGVLIDMSRHKRGRQTSPGAFPTTSAPDTISPPAEFIDAEVYYINYANSGHWGHFLTETLARVNHLDESLMNVFVSGDLGVVKKMYPHHNYVSFSSIIRVDKLLLPVPTMVNCYSVFPEHIDTCRKLGDYYGRENAKYGKVYLSRTKLTKSNRWTEQEPVLEEMLKNAGWTIVHMQEHSVREQLGILENSDIIAGCIGSAFHNLMMTRRNPGKVVYLTCDEFDTNPNYALHDAILGNNSVYLDCQSVVNKSNRTKKIHNPQEVFEYLEDACK